MIERHFQVKTPLVSSELSKHGACIELHKVNMLQLRVSRLRQVYKLRRINKGQKHRVALFGQKEQKVLEKNIMSAALILSLNFFCPSEFNYDAQPATCWKQPTGWFLAGSSSIRATFLKHKTNTVETPFWFKYYSIASTITTHPKDGVWFCSEKVRQTKKGWQGLLLGEYVWGSTIFFFRFSNI